jgi:hypothetical protein
MGIFRFVEHENSLTEASNKIALLLAGNTPFYPIYLYFILGHHGLPWYLLSAASLPFFCATFWIARVNGFYSRIWLCLAALANSFFVTWLLGEASGTGLFLIPCISLAVLSFSGAELMPMAALTALPYVVYYFLHGHFPPPPALYSAKEYRSLTTLSEASVASVTAAVAYIFSRAREK